MGEKVPKEVDLGNVFKTEAKDPSMIAYLKSLGSCFYFPRPQHVVAIPVSLLCIVVSLASIEKLSP
jgi:hypothetical protein